MVTTNGLARVTLPDGRRLDSWQGGDPAGAPVVLFHGTPGGRLQAAMADGAARRAAVRLVAFSRPGYGGSTDTSTTLASIARDAITVADLLGIGRFAVVGISGGGPFALATAALAPERVGCVGVVAGVGPTSALRCGADGAGGQSEVELQDQMHRWESVPRPGTFVSPEILEPWTPAGRPGVPAYRGASRDALAVSAGWDIHLADITAPVLLWYGDRDRMVPLEHGRWLHERLPTSTLVVREDAGHLGTLMPYWGEVMTTVGAAAVANWTT